MSKLNFNLALILGLFVAVVLASTGYAQGDEDETTQVKKVTRKYAGGQDEQPLTVQTSLPLSTRYPDAPRPTPSAAGGESATHD